MALSANTLDELVKVSLRDEWSSVKKKWFPRTDEHQDFDKRTPGNYYNCIQPQFRDRT